MDLHSITEYKTIDLDAFEQQALYEKRGLIPQIAPRYRAPYFAHIFNGGYAAGYYGYLWAEVLDKDAFQVFTKSGATCSIVRLPKRSGARFSNREEALTGLTLFKNFMGREPQVLAMMVAPRIGRAPCGRQHGAYRRHRHRSRLNPNRLRENQDALTSTN